MFCHLNLSWPTSSRAGDTTQRIDMNNVYVVELICWEKYSGKYSHTQNPRITMSLGILHCSRAGMKFPWGKLDHVRVFSPLCRSYHQKPCRESHLSEVAWWLKSCTGQQETPAHVTSLCLLYNIKLKNKIKNPQFIMFINTEKKPVCYYCINWNLGICL